MRRYLRPPLVALVPLLPLVLVAALSGGCSTDGDVADGPTVTATGPSGSKTSAADEPTEATPDEGTSAPSALPDAVAAVCTPWAAMASAIQDVVSGTADPEAVAAEIGPVMKEFAERLPRLERPPGLSVATWRGVQALARRILALPDRPTRAEVEAVESDLSEQHRDAVKSAAVWLRANCPT